MRFKRLFERFERLDKGVIATDSPYKVKDLCMNTDKSYRILYDSRIGYYLLIDISASQRIVHYDTLRIAYQNGLYASQDEFINELGDLYNYWELGKDGGFVDDSKDDSEELDPYLFCIKFFRTNDPEDEGIGYDDYYTGAKYPYGNFYTRDFTLDEIPLYQALGEPTEWLS